MVRTGQTAAGVTVPDTKLARDATELVRERFVPGYQRGNFVDIIENSDWPE
jgi:hypothetical protein